jgi:hypothetical protein
MVAKAEEWRGVEVVESAWYIRCTSGNGGCDPLHSRISATLIGWASGLGSTKCNRDDFCARLFFLLVNS